LFGAETSTNAARRFSAGLKGRFQEERRADDHVLDEALTYVPAVAEGRLATREVPALLALNEDLRRDFVADCEKGVARWNRTLRDGGVDLELRLPHEGFHRQVGAYSALRVSPDGRVVDDVAPWLP